MFPETVFQDKWLLVLDKPEGVLSHPNPGGRGGEAVLGGKYDFDDRRFDTPEGPRWLIHRLDQDTSGLLMLALDANTAKALRGLFEEGKVEKHYTALVGGPLPKQAVWKDRLDKKQQSGRVRSVVVKGSPNAELRFFLKKPFRRSNLSLVDVQLVTGRTHQIRVQFSHRQFPLAGDRIYGDFEFNREIKKRTGLDRLFLHASGLSFPHPVSGKAIRIESSLPAELASCLSRLA